MARVTKNSGGYKPRVVAASELARDQSENLFTDVESKQTRNIKEAGDSESDGTESMFIRQSNTAPAKRPKSLRNQQTHASRSLRPSEYEEDLGRKVNRKVLVSTKHSKTKNKAHQSKDVRAFKKYVEDQQQILENLLTDVNHDMFLHLALSNDHFKTAYKSALLSNHSSIRSGQGLPGFINKDTSPLYLHWKNLLLESSNLIEGYNNIETELEAFRKDILPAIEAQSTFDGVSNLLDAGHEVGLSKIEAGVLGASGTEDGSNPKVDSSLYSTGDEAAGIWERVARKQTKAVNRTALAINVQ